MKTKYNEFLNESSNFNKYELKGKINSLDGKWLVKQEGLGMMYIIDNVLTPYKTKLPPNEIQKFNKGLSILRKTDFPNIDFRLEKSFPDGISNATLVYIDGKWSFVNKLNTNYQDLPDLLVYVIELMMNDEKNSVKSFIEPIYENIMVGNVKEGLLLLKPKLESIINYYFIKNGNGLNDFLKFTKNIERNSKQGEIAEDNVSEFLLSKGFTIEYQGGNGDFIDMIFGSDLIVYREDFGYKTIQVKSYQPKIEDVKYYKINWIAVSNGNVTILDKNTFEPINL